MTILNNIIWEPIETAPKNKFFILGFIPGWYDIPTPVYWNLTLNSWVLFLTDDKVSPSHWTIISLPEE